MSGCGVGHIVAAAVVSRFRNRVLVGGGVGGWCNCG